MNKPYEIAEVIQWCGWLSHSFNDLLKRPIIDHDLSAQNLLRALYEDSRVILSHRYEDVPRFCFANAAAQKQFGYSWSEFIGMDSKFSAKPDGIAARAELLNRARRDGYVDDYSGVRVRKNGTTFAVENVILWNVSNDNAEVVGQAAIFNATP